MPISVDVYAIYIYIYSIQSILYNLHLYIHYIILTMFVLKNKINFDSLQLSTNYGLIINDQYFVEKYLKLILFYKVNIANNIF